MSEKINQVSLILYILCSSTHTKLYVRKYWIIFSFLGRKSVVCPRLGTWQMKVASQKWWRRAHVAAGRRLALPSPRRPSSRWRGEAFIAQRTVIWWRKRRQNEQRLYSAHTGATSFFPHYFQSKSLYPSLAMSYLYLCNCADLFHPWKYEKTTSNVNTLAKLQECSVLTGWAKSKIMFHKNSSPLDLFTMTLLSVL